MLILLWTILLQGAASAQNQTNQNGQSDVCPFQTQTWKTTLEKLQDLCASVTDNNSTCSQQTLTQNLEKLAIETKANREADLESSKKLEDTLVDAKDGILKEMKNYFDKVVLSLGSEVKSLTQKMDDKFAELDGKVLRKCTLWKEKVSGLELKKLETGAYHFGEAYHSWKGAVEFCKSRGMNLATIKSEKEKTLFEAHRQGTSWVGASDIGHEPGQFFWTDGRPVDQQWRYDAKSYREGKETCLHLDRKLWDYPCTDKWRFICEVGPDDLHCV